MIYTYEYDSSVYPALPVIEVKVSAFGQSGEKMTLRAVVDSGADSTMLPLRYLKKIKSRKVGQANLRGITGIRCPVDIYEVVIQLGPYDIPKLRVIADRHNQEMILGRDALNQMIVTLNGLASVVEIS
ncbi:MAG: protease [Chloroflexi bacterium]|nr:protease [Chloroflexota bacterium]